MSEKPKIEPTVGRVVHYVKDGAVLAAIVAAVHSDECVTLSVIDANGNPRGVGFVQHEDAIVTIKDDESGLVTSPAHATGDGCWRWMPYQLGQAAKTEAVIAAAKPKA